MRVDTVITFEAKIKKQGFLVEDMRVRDFFRPVQACIMLAEALWFCLDCRANIQYLQKICQYEDQDIVVQVLENVDHLGMLTLPVEININYKLFSHYIAEIKHPLRH